MLRMTDRFMKGDCFILRKKGRLWHWILWKKYGGPVAYSTQGYQSRSAAKKVNQVRT